MKNLIIILITSFAYSFMIGEKICLPGNIVVSRSNYRYSFYHNSDKTSAELALTTNKGIWHDGLIWLHNTQSFLGMEGLKNEKGATIRINVVHFDSAGNVIDRIYEAQNNEIVGVPYPSRNDKNLVFSSGRRGDYRINPFEGLNREESFVIMDYEQRKVLKKIEHVGSSLNVGLHESPWLYDEDRFIYTMSGERKISVEGKDINPVDEEKFGIYIYDLKSDEQKLLIPKGRFGICSPVDLKVGYILDESIWVLDLTDNTKREIYKGHKKGKITNLHWTPDGKYIYLAYYNNPGSEWSAQPGEKLIEISSGKEVAFNKIGLGFHSYTWK